MISWLASIKNAFDPITTLTSETLVPRTNDNLARMTSCLTQSTQLIQLYSCACEQLQYFFIQHYQRRLEREFRDAERNHNIKLPRWTKDYFFYYIYLFYIFLVILSSIVAIRTVVSTVRWCFTAPYWLLAVPAISGWIALSDLGLGYF